MGFSWVQVVVPVLIACITSSGLWGFLNLRSSKTTQTDRLLRGLAYAQIVSRGEIYIDRGWLTQDEYEEYYNYLYMPYKELGGNGAAERMVLEVKGLPFKASIRCVEMFQDSRTRRIESEPIEHRGHTL